MKTGCVRVTAPVKNWRVSTVSADLGIVATSVGIYPPPSGFSIGLPLGSVRMFHSNFPVAELKLCVGTIMSFEMRRVLFCV